VPERPPKLASNSRPTSEAAYARVVNGAARREPPRPPHSLARPQQAAEVTQLPVNAHNFRSQLPSQSRADSEEPSGYLNTNQHFRRAPPVPDKLVNPPVRKPEPPAPGKSWIRATDSLENPLPVAASASLDNSLPVVDSACLEERGKTQATPPPPPPPPPAPAPPPPPAALHFKAEASSAGYAQQRAVSSKDDLLAEIRKKAGVEGAGLRKVDSCDASRNGFYESPLRLECLTIPLCRPRYIGNMFLQQGVYIGLSG
jgi:hypothetical protein